MKGNLFFEGENFMLNYKKGKKGAINDSLKCHNKRFEENFINQTNDYREATQTIITLYNGNVIRLKGGLMPKRIIKKYKQSVKQTIYLK